VPAWETLFISATAAATAPLAALIERERTRAEDQLDKQPHTGSA
jgi:hypothetical protein